MRKRWNGLDLRWRVMVAAVIVFLAMEAGLFCLLIGVYKKVGREHIVMKADLIGSWLAGQTKAALAEGRPEIADIKKIVEYPGVRRAIVFDVDGRTFVPLSAHGRPFGERGIIDEVLRKGIKIRRYLPDGGLEFFGPVVEGTAAQKIYGAIYLNLERAGISGAAYLSAVLAGAAFFLLVYWIFKETMASIGGLGGDGDGRRFDALRGAVRRTVDARMKDAVYLFEAEWRKFVHALSSPVMVLDRSLRLIEVNGAAIKRFGRDDWMVEGRHIVDILEQDSLKEPVMELLGRVSMQDGGLVRSDNSPVTIVSLYNGQTKCNEDTNFKYILLF